MTYYIKIDSFMQQAESDNIHEVAQEVAELVNDTNREIKILNENSQEIATSHYYGIQFDPNENESTDEWDTTPLIDFGSAGFYTKFITMDGIQL